MAAFKPGRSPFRVPGSVVVFVVALAVRLLYLLEARGFPTFDLPLIDSAQYDGLARVLSSGGPAPATMFLQGVFYPLSLAAVYALSDGSIPAAKVLQMVLGATTCALTCRLGMRLFDRRVGLAAGLMAACYGPLIFYDGELLSTGWETFWSVALLLMILAAHDQPTRWRMLGLGLGAGSAVLTRATFLPFLLLTGAWLAWRIAGALKNPTAGRRDISHRPGRPARLLGCLAFALSGFLMVVVPAAAWNHHLSGQWSVLPANGPLNLYIGNNPDRCATLTARPGPNYDRLLRLPAERGINEPRDQQRFYERQVFDHARRQPLRFLGGMVAKAAEFVTSREIPNTEQIYLFRPWSWTLSALVWTVGPFGFPFGVLLPLAAVGLIAAPRRLPAPIWLFLALYPAAVVLVHVCARYRAPVIPVLCILAAAGLLSLFHRRGAEHTERKREVRGQKSEVGQPRGTRHSALDTGRYSPPHLLILSSSHPVILSRPHPVITTLVAVAVLLLSTLPGPFCLETLDYKTEFHLLLGHRHVEQRRFDQAVPAFRTALTTAGPAHVPDVERSLGHALVAQGRLDDGIAHLHEAVRIDPEAGEGHALLGEALLLQGRHPEAVQALRQAVRLKPDLFEAWSNLGTALYQLGQVNEGIDAARRARQLKPGAPTAALNLGLMLLNVGRAGEAVIELQAAMAIDPHQPQPRFFLGLALESAGRPAEAAQTYRALLQLVPDHAQARARLRMIEAAASSGPG